MKHIVTQEWLSTHLSRSNVLIYDCRFNLADPEEGRNRYLKSHIPSAVHVDLDKDLSREITEHGGRHPLPSQKEAAATFGRLGINEEKTVVAYDDQNGSMAARLWWMLKFLGHEKVFVLQGGYSAWEEAGYPVTDERTVPEPTDFIIRESDWKAVGMEEVKQAMQKENTVIIDSRDAARYSGEQETIDKKAGHIPGAINKPWLKNSNSTKEWHSTEELAELHKDLAGKKEIVVYCGSGVTACANILGMSEAGIEQAVLYPGSWSDWISYDDNPVETKK
ncbi:thiosulfate/3-mercaptopyruvate sulfurtransferase [Fictibacillus enclensis]|uniref:3-mercaptopyruvate sulfurtransferase n=1 Tax=Fictibacillus enclensis TaxID=1017270 RepID=A0A0V8JE28_9BACL|nr:sulfurtransferase [Fictibacillus enclensis]KSU85241.1 3-mercaptopyruvate sulfurtransferase [Fictibacillus enclensis]SCB93476.1 thiosulfate/3-mercaptopyruvate sulfurtransferase [Fictibacillus enclensis]